MNLIAYEWDKQCESIDLNTLIALCELGEDYKAFCDDLELLIPNFKTFFTLTIPFGIRRMW